MNAPAAVPQSSSRTAGASHSRTMIDDGSGPTKKTEGLVQGKGAWLLAAASCLLLLLAAAQGYVSFRAQYSFVDHAKRARVPSMLEALGLDTGAVIFAVLALALACCRRRAAVERVLNVSCALGSLLMNLLAGDLASPRSVTVWVLPSALYALTSDRLIAVVRRWVQDDAGDQVTPEGSAWQAAGGLMLWLLRLTLDVPGTLTAFRRWVLAVAPVAPGVRAGILPIAVTAAALPAASDGNETDDGADPGTYREPINPTPPAGVGEHPAVDVLTPGELKPGETKRDALIRLYEHYGKNGDPRYGDQAKTAALAGEIARRIGYHAGTARRELAKYLDSQSPTGPADLDPGSDAPPRSQSRAHPEPGSHAEAVA